MVDPENERSEEQKVISYCAIVVYNRRVAPPVLRSSFPLTYKGAPP